jgi:hypothetical protein
MQSSIKRNFVTQKQRETAIDYLINRLSPEIFLTLNDHINSEEWPHQFHLGFGQMVRNALREHFDWDDLVLDAEWVGLIEAATTRFIKAEAETKAKKP